MGILRRTLLVITGILLLGYGALVAWAYWPTAPGVPAKSLATPEDQFVTVNGLELRYRQWGIPASGQPTLVLIHGFANSVQTWRSVAPLLAPDHHIIALDMPGFGLSAKPADHDYSNPSQAAVAVAFMRQMGLREAVVGGHSMGGALALHVAAQAPDVVTGLLLLNPGIITTGVPAITQYLVFPFPRISAKTFGDRDFRTRFLRNSYVNPEIVTEAVLDDVMLAARTDDYLAGATQLNRYYIPGNELAMLSDIRLPVLIVWGAEDPKPDGEAEALRDQLAVSRLVKVPGAGHYVHEEAPEATAASVRAAAGFWGAQR